MSALVNLCIEDFSYLVFKFTIDFNRCEWQFDMVRDRTRHVWFEHGDVKDGINGL